MTRVDAVISWVRVDADFRAQERADFGVSPGQLDRMAMETATPQTLLLLHIGRSILARRSTDLE